MQNNTFRIQDKNELAGFVKSLGSQSMFVSILMETAVDMVKKHRVTKLPNPFLGTVKRSHRNGLLNVDYKAAVERKVKEVTGLTIDYQPGETWYVNFTNEQGKALPLCHHKADTGRMYVQFYPHKYIGQTSYWLNGVQLTPAQVTEMKEYLSKDDKSEFKPNVIAPALDSIRLLKARRVTIKNELLSKIAGNLARFAKTPVSTQDSTAPLVTA